MLIPAKHEQLQKNVLVIGADIVSILKKRRWSIEKLYEQVKILKSISLDQYFNTLTYLYLIDFIDLDNHYISLKTKNVS